MGAPEFVAVGHVTLDRFGEATRPGGAALFAAVTAHRLGFSVGLLTSHGDDFPLALVPPQIEVVTVPAPRSTVFEHRMEGGGRVMRVLSVARPLGVTDIPEDWRDAPLVLLAPVLDEVDPLVAAAFGEGAIGAAAQGWLRDLGPDRAVTGRPWESSDALFGRLQAFFLSREDVRGQEASVVEWVQRVPFGVLTAGSEGALLFVNGERYAVRPRSAREVDATGAGDVFAATFLLEYHRGASPWEAAEAAACAAALSVEGEGWSTVPDGPALEAALAAYRREE